MVDLACTFATVHEIVAHSHWLLFIMKRISVVTGDIETVTASPQLSQELVLSLA